MEPELERPATPVVDRLPAPIELPGLVKAVLALYRRRFPLWFGPTLVTYVLIHLVQVLAIEFLFDQGLSDVVESGLQLFLGIAFVAMVGSLLVTFLIPGMAAATVGQSISFGESVRRARERRGHPFVALLYAALVGMAMLLPPFGFLFQIIGSEISLAAVAGPPILIHAVVLEGLGLRDGWTRTKEVMRGQWLRVMMNILTIALGLGIVLFPILQGAFYLADRVGIRGDLAGDIFGLSIQSVFGALALPLVFLAWFVSYLDVRARKDGYTREELEDDVVQMAERQAGLTGP